MNQFAKFGKHNRASSNRRGQHTRIWTGLAAISLLTLGTFAGAQDPNNRDGDVSVGGEHVLTIRFPAGGLSVRQRAEAVETRLVTILADPNLKPADIVAVPIGSNDAKIMVKNKILVTVDAQTAKFNGTKALNLAQSWTTHLRQVLPKVSIKPNPNLENGETAPDAGAK